MEGVKILWQRLNRPGVEAFRKELKRRGIDVPADELREFFYQQQSSKQLFAPGPKYEGKIFSKGLDAKWFADIAVVDEKYWIVAQDEFSRYGWAEPIKKPMEAYTGFREILARAGHAPRELVTDGDKGFVAPVFQTLLEAHDIHWRLKSGRQDLAIVDRLIGTIKRSLAEDQAEGRDATVHDVVAGQNERVAPAVRGAPLELRKPGGGVGDKVLFFDRMWDEAKALRDTVRAQDARAAHLAKVGAFRVYQPHKGPRRRIDDPVWSRKLHLVAGFDGAYVRGDDGERHLTKEVLPVSTESGDVAPARQKLKRIARTQLNKYREAAEEYLRARGGRASAMALGVALKKVGDLKTDLRLANISKVSPITGLARVFPDVFKQDGYYLELK